MLLNDLRDEIHQTAVAKGWWDLPRTFGDIIALCHSELSEALESHRNQEPLFFIKDGKPEGVSVEMIDCLIRILDWAGFYNVDLDTIIKVKMQYNDTREFRHGNKVL